jgi:hypothetical protein
MYLPMIKLIAGGIMHETRRREWCCCSTGIATLVILLCASLTLVSAEAPLTAELQEDVVFLLDVSASMLEPNGLLTKLLYRFLEQVSKDQRPPDRISTAVGDLLRELDELSSGRIWLIPFKQDVFFPVEGEIPEGFSGYPVAELHGDNTRQLGVNLKAFLVGNSRPAVLPLGYVPDGIPEKWRGVVHAVRTAEGNQRTCIWTALEAAVGILEEQRSLQGSDEAGLGVHQHQRIFLYTDGCNSTQCTPQGTQGDLYRRIQTLANQNEVPLIHLKLVGGPTQVRNPLSEVLPTSIWHVEILPIDTMNSVGIWPNLADIMIPGGAINAGYFPLPHLEIAVESRTSVITPDALTVSLENVSITYSYQLFEEIDGLHSITIPIPDHVCLLKDLGDSDTCLPSLQGFKQLESDASRFSVSIEICFFARRLAGTFSDSVVDLRQRHRQELVWVGEPCLTGELLIRYATIGESPFTWSIPLYATSCQLPTIDVDVRRTPAAPSKGTIELASNAAARSIYDLASAGMYIEYQPELVWFPDEEDGNPGDGRFFLPEKLYSHVFPFEIRPSRQQDSCSTRIGSIRVVDPPAGVALTGNALFPFRIDGLHLDSDVIPLRVDVSNGQSVGEQEIIVSVALPLPRDALQFLDVSIDPAPGLLNSLPILSIVNPEYGTQDNRSSHAALPAAAVNLRIEYASVEDLLQFNDTDEEFRLVVTMRETEMSSGYFAYGDAIVNGIPIDLMYRKGDVLVRVLDQGNEALKPGDLAAQLFLQCMACSEQLPVGVPAALLRDSALALLSAETGETCSTHSPAVATRDGAVYSLVVKEWTERIGEQVYAEVDLRRWTGIGPANLILEDATTVQVQLVPPQLPTREVSEKLRMQGDEPVSLTVGEDLEILKFRCSQAFFDEYVYSSIEPSQRFELYSRGKGETTYVVLRTLESISPDQTGSLRIEVQLRPLALHEPVVAFERDFKVERRPGILKLLRPIGYGVSGLLLLGLVFFFIRKFVRKI